MAPIHTTEPRPRPDVRRRHRLAPDLRRVQLLDVAARIIAEEGGAALTMDRVAVEAGVSKGLVYLYFRNRGALMMCLHDREHTRFVGEAQRRFDAAGTFEERARAITGAYFDAVEERGHLFYRLMSERSVEDEAETLRCERRDRLYAYWTEQICDEIGLDSERAAVLAELFVSMAEAGASHILTRGTDRATVEELHYTVVFAAVREMQAQSRSYPR